MDPGETATAFAYVSWSWTVVCLFLSGIFFGSFISGMLLSWKALLSSKFWALLGYEDEALGEEGNRLGQEGSASLHSLGSNISKDSSLIQQADSACYHLPPESKSIISERSSFYKRGYKYDVYLSFAGDKKCIRFINYLKYHLLKEEILVYRDEVDLQKVEIITARFRQGIKDSRISIVVFSRHFASSILCLEELVAIVDCHKNMKQELVPIFYDVDPRDVGHQRGACMFAFDSLRKRLKDDKIHKWKEAMTYLAKLSGFHLTHQGKAQWIERIVEEVSDILVYKFQRTRSTDKTPGSTQRRPSLQDVNKYDVFLSLRRTHTSYTLIDNLYHCLTKEGFSTFKSDHKIQRTESIPSQVLQAIKDSQILIVVFTRDYADSTSSLEEIATIVECHRKPKQTIIPVFFDVDSMDVQRQTGPYEKAFASYTEEFKHDPFKVQRWRSALKRMANLSGVVLRDEPEIQAIGKIIQIVVELCSRLSSHNQVGIQSNLNMLEKLLKLEDDCVLVLGIWGMVGSGKTTHALALYDRICEQFEAACFIKEVSQVYRNGGATAVQKQILNGTLNEKLSDVYSPFEISGLARKLLSWKRILIVFDNVDELMHLKELAINPIVLGMGSRIIITTRNRQILNAYGVDEIYRIPLLSKDEARELFLNACRGGIVNDQSCSEFIPRVLEYAYDLPLAIKVLASLLQYRDVTFWQHTLNRLRRGPFFEIMEPLQTSFESLDQEEKEIFLHIACFFHGKRGDYVIQVLNCCGFFAEIGIQALLDKSLITIQNEEIHMHGLLQDLGKKIVREEDPKNPALRSRLWLSQDFSIALNSTTKGSKVKSIVLYESTSTSQHEYLKIEGLSKMRNLVLLILYDQDFGGSLPSLPHRLRYLLWQGYSFSSLPSFEPYNRLVELNLPNSRIEHLWNGCKNFPRLERVDLSYSEELMETPNFEGSPSLKQLDLTGCTNLVQVHRSIGHLIELAYLSFRDCYKLVTLNLDHECKLSSLRVLDLYNCKNLKNIPDFTGLPNLEHIDLGDCTSLSTLHHSIVNLKKLKFLKVPATINLLELSDVTIIQTPLVSSHGEKL